MNDKKEISTKNRHIASLNNIISQIEGYLGLDLYNKENKKYKMQPITKCVKGVAEEYKRLSIKDKKVMVTKLTNGAITFNALAVSIYASQDNIVSFKTLPENRTIYDILTAMQTNRVIVNYRKKVVKCLHSILARTDDKYVEPKDEMSYRLLRILFILLVIEQTKIIPIYVRGVLALYEDGQGLVGDKTSLRLTKSTIDEYCDKLDVIMKKQNGEVEIKTPQRNTSGVKVSTPNRGVKVNTPNQGVKVNTPQRNQKADNVNPVRVENPNRGKVENPNRGKVSIKVNNRKKPENTTVKLNVVSGDVEKKPTEASQARKQPERKVIVSSNGTRIEETAKMEANHEPQKTTRPAHQNIVVNKDKINGTKPKGTQGDKSNINKVSF